jgi:hypothetical protein
MKKKEMKRIKLKNLKTINEQKIILLILEPDFSVIKNFHFYLNSLINSKLNLISVG